MRSLREGSRAHALRRARTCYDHLAGRLGVAVFAALVEQGLVIGGDGRHRPDRARDDRLSAAGRDVDYRLTADGARRLEALGVVVPAPDDAGAIALRYCVDWSEQQHHLSGAVGRALCSRLVALGWLRRLSGTRAVRVTPEGERELRRHFGVAASS